MRNYTPAHLAGEHRIMLRQVALAYRRTYRKTRAEGALSPLIHQRAREAAMSEFYAQVEGEPPELLVASARVSEMIAAAINADTRWFWHGPNA